MQIIDTIPPESGGDASDLIIDPIIPKPDIVKASNLSNPTIWREQRAGRFPPWIRISAGRVGMRLSIYQQWLDGRRDWGGDRLR